MRQPPQRGHDLVTLSGPQGAGLGAGCVRHRHRRVLVDDLEMAQSRPGAVDHGLAEVSDRFVRFAQPPPGPVHRDERVLDDVLRGRGVVEEQRGEPDQRAVVSRVESDEHLVGVACGGVHETPPSIRRDDIHHDGTTPTRPSGFTDAPTLPACRIACSVASCPARYPRRSSRTTRPPCASATSTRPPPPTCWSSRGRICPTWRRSERPSRTRSSPCSRWPNRSPRTRASPATGRARATAWSPTPGLTRTRPSSTLTCTFSAAAQWGGHRAKLDSTMATKRSDTSASTRIVVPGAQNMVGLLGSSDELLRLIERAFTSDIHVRGNEITITGDRAEVDLAARLFEELITLLERGDVLTADAVQRSLAMLRQQTQERPADVLSLNILSSRGRTIRPKTLNQKRYVDAIDAHTVIFGIGPAGTGKTYLAMAKAVQALQAKQVNRIILTRPAVEAGERLGFLPGTLNEKIDPYLRPLYDALHDMIDPDSIPRLMASGTIEVAPLAYMRGRTINDSFIVLDEAQNTTPEQMKMFLTRLGFGSKMVVTGDVTQVDLPVGVKSGLRVVQEILEGIEDVHFCRLTSHDVVRHRLVSDIVDAYAKWDAQDSSTQSNETSAPSRQTNSRRRAGR